MDEAPVWFSVNGVRSVLLTCSPVRLDALCVGHLIAEGWIADATQAHGIRVVNGPGGSAGVELSIPDEQLAAAEMLQHHRLEHGCGLRHVLDCTGTVRQAAPAQSPADLGAAFRALFAAADAAAPGGVHAAAFCNAGGALEAMSVDVARHCAVDRAIGTAAMAGTRGSGLVLSSRISGAIALKAVNAGVPWVASRSIATPLAREIAGAGGVRLIEQAVRRS